MNFCKNLSTGFLENFTTISDCRLPNFGEPSADSADVTGYLNIVLNIYPYEVAILSKEKPRHFKERNSYIDNSV